MTQSVGGGPVLGRVLELPGKWEGPAYLGRLLWEAGFEVECLVSGSPQLLPNKDFSPYLEVGKRVITKSELAGRPRFDLVVSDEPLPRAIRSLAPCTQAINCVVAAGTPEHPVRSCLTLYARSGLMFSNGYPESAPRSVNGSGLAYLTAVACFGPVLAALQQPASERPSEVRVSGFELAVTLDYSGAAMWEYLGLERQRPGRNIGQNHPVSLYRCRDGAVFLNVVTEEQWQRLCVLIGDPGLMEDERFQTSRSRRVHADALNERLDAWFITQSAEEVTRACQELRVPCEVVRLLSDAVRDPQLLARDFWGKGPDGRWYPKSFSGITPPMDRGWE